MIDRLVETGSPLSREADRVHPLLRLAVLTPIVVFAPVRPAAADPPPLAGIRRVVFLGDSITYSGQYLEFVEAYLRLKGEAAGCTFLDLGLPSETASGLTEPGHAGGKFPRPNLHERLDRVLAQTRPDLVVACYGMNDGIYYPFSLERSQKFQDGITRLHERAAAAGAKVLHLTPPVFDPVPIKARTLPAGRDEYRQPYEGYDEVLARYSAWLLDQRAQGWDVVDIHGPIRRHLADERGRDPSFRFAGDGVHIDANGHWLIAREVLEHWGIAPREIAGTADQAFAADPRGAEVLKLVQRKQRVLKEAWLTATGHKRPGMNRGLPLPEAERQAKALDDEIDKRLAAKP